SADCESRQKPPWQAFPDLISHVEPAEVGDELPAEQLLHHLRVLDRQRPVEAPLVPDHLELRGRDVVARDPRGRVAARDGVEDDEDEHRHREQHEHHRGEATSGEADHVCFTYGCRRPYGSSARRTPSPSRLSISTVRAMSAPGTSASAGAVWIRSTPSSTSVPHDGS